MEYIYGVEILLTYILMTCVWDEEIHSLIKEKLYISIFDVFAGNENCSQTIDEERR